VRVASRERFQALLKTSRIDLDVATKAPSSSRRLTDVKTVGRPYDSSKYSVRLIALKFAYLGQRYNGFEHHANNRTRLPTIEEVLWKALVKARLIQPKGTGSGRPDDISWEGCQYSKCGRTDRGVSAFGQVIGIRVRSNRPLPRSQCSSSPGAKSPTENVEILSPPLSREITNMPPSDIRLEDPDVADALNFDAVHDEIPYPKVLNRLLPPDIRVLAWCPAPPSDFSARFSCRERQYRYFFTQPAFTPTPGAGGLKGTGSNREGWLDVEAMKGAAKRYEGLHDFRNLCKVDASKQLNNFVRRIYLSEIREVDPASAPAAYVSGRNFAQESHSGASGSSADVDSVHPRVYVFVLHGSAFLWHQVRHMVAILFLVGQGLERPELVDELMDVERNPCKPRYVMADDAPLVLWDCVFPREGSECREDALTWVYVGESARSGKGDHSITAVKGDGKHGASGVVEDMWQLWRQKKIDEILTGSLLNLVVSGGQHSHTTPTRPSVYPESKEGEKVFLGGNGALVRGKYIQVMQKAKLESVLEINAKYAVRKGLPPRVGEGDVTFRRVPQDSRTDHTHAMGTQ